MTKGLGKALLVGGFAVAAASATPAIAATDGKDRGAGAILQPGRCDG